MHSTSINNLVFWASGNIYTTQVGALSSTLHNNISKTQLNKKHHQLDYQHIMVSKSTPNNSINNPSSFTKFGPISKYPFIRHSLTSNKLAYNTRGSIQQPTTYSYFSTKQPLPCIIHCKRYDDIWVTINYHYEWMILYRRMHTFTDENMHLIS